MITKTTKETQEWIKKHGDEEFIPPDKMPEGYEGFSLTKKGAFIMLLNWLKKEEEDSYAGEWVVPFYQNQMIAAIECIAAIAKRRFCDNSKNTYVQLCSQTQAGKTGTLIAIEQVFQLPFFKTHLKLRSPMVVQCPSDKSLAEQTDLRTPNRVLQLRMSMASTLENTIACKQEWDGCKSEEERKELLKKWSRLRQLHGAQKRPAILPGSLVMLDESHHGTGKKSVAEKVLNVWGVDLSKDLETWNTENVHIVSVSATPMAETLATQNYPWVDRVILRPGPTYYGIDDMLNDAKIKESWALKANSDIQKLIDDVVEPFITGGRNEFGIIRLPIGGGNTWQYKNLIKKLQKAGIRILEGVPDSQSSKNYDVAFVNLDQGTSKDEDLQKFLGAPSSGKEKWFNDAPAIPSIVFVKNMLAMGATLKNEHISFVFERKRKNDTTDVDFAVQSLAGRATGYDDKSHCPTIYSSLEDLEIYRNWVVSGYRPALTPYRARRVKGKKKVSHQNHDVAVPISSLSGNEIRLLDNKKKREKRLETVLEKINNHGSTDIKNALASIPKSQLGNLYQLANWSDGQDVFEELQQPEITGMGGFFQGGATCCFFLKKEKKHYHIGLLFDQRKTVDYDSVPNRTMYQE
jgi:hypothetical protein